MKHCLLLVGGRVEGRETLIPCCTEIFMSQAWPVAQLVPQPAEGG
jgi:hypothetical protein